MKLIPDERTTNNQEQQKLVGEMATPTPPNLYCNLKSSHQHGSNGIDVDADGDIRSYDQWKSSNESIREMQAKQSHIQKDLEFITRQPSHRGQKCFDGSHNREKGQDTEDEDEELAEFRRLENEVKIVELNKQMDAIQEKIRMKLFNQLFTTHHNSDSSSSEGLSSSSDFGFDQASKTSSNQSSSELSITPNRNNNGRNNHQLVKSFACTGEFYDMPTMNNMYERHKRMRSPKSDCDSLKRIGENEALLISNCDDDQLRSDSNSAGTESVMSCTYDLTPTTSRQSDNQFNSLLKHNSIDLDGTDGSCNQSIPSQSLDCYIAPYLNDKIIGRSNTTNRDLARIDEDEEELPELNLNGLSIKNSNHNYSFIESNDKSQNVYEKDNTTFETKGNSAILDDGEIRNIIRKNAGLTIGTTKQNRPLTLYLPKPDEEIDLLDHIQTLGHDMNIISGEMHLSSTSAHGYLWKLCMRSTNKWRKRYFLFDRQKRFLCYYKNERDLVKNRINPSNIIHFEDILDVYVDHKLSGICEKNRSASSRNYIFVLASKQRNFTLASSKAETMRVWIDIMFTAAQSCDYFLYNEEE